MPWDNDDILTIFRQITRQLGNLAHTTADAPIYRRYAYILEKLANVRIACLLVDLAQMECDDMASDDSTGDINQIKSPVESNDALEVLVELVHTLLSSVRREHSLDLLELVNLTICGCLEYHSAQGIPIPIPLLDELLHAIGQGRTTWILAANAFSVRTKKTQQLPQIEVPNPTYQVAAKVIRTLLNKLATPIADLLNGVLNGEQHVIDQTTIQYLDAEQDNDQNDTNNSSECEINNIIVELHLVAPSTLTTVIGTISPGLRSTSSKQRLQVTQLLGRLFTAVNSSNELHDKYGPVFREWLGRHLDVDVEIRMCMVQHCMTVLKAITDKNSNSTIDSDIAVALAEALKQLTTQDQAYDVRSSAVRKICDWAYQQQGGTAVTAMLLQAVGTRVRSKNKHERKDAVTGLAHIYCRQWIEPQLKAIVDGGDDCDIEIIIKTLHEMCNLQLTPSPRSHKHGHHNQTEEWKDNLEEHFAWIPSTVFECACYSDQVDTDMRSRVYQILDESLLGKKLTPTAQAVAMTAVIDSLVEQGTGAQSLLTASGNHSTSLKFLQQLLSTRSALQKAVSQYIDTRSEVRNLGAGMFFIDFFDRVC